MRKTIIALFALAIIAGFAAFAWSEEAKKAPVYYVCGCGADCNCGAISTEPGKCKCGKDMVQMHLLSVEGSDALLCTCGADCNCKIDPSDKTKCGCGKPVKTVSIKGKYACACGPDCSCGMISDKPGKCGCGKDLKMVE